MYDNFNVNLRKNEGFLFIFHVFLFRNRVNRTRPQCRDEKIQSKDSIIFSLHGTSQKTSRPRIFKSSENSS